MHVDERMMRNIKLSIQAEDKKELHRFRYFRYSTKFRYGYSLSINSHNHVCENKPTHKIIILEFLLPILPITFV